MQASLERLRQRREEGREGGFTLIELLIVIVVLAILAAIVVFAVSNLTGSSAQASCRADFNTVQTATEAFKAQVGAYPGDTGAYFTGVTGPTATPTAPTGWSGNVPVNDLLSTYTVAGQTVGPWLKTYPFNPGHYQIEVDATTYGQVEVFNTASTATEIPATSPTYTPNDCSSVS